MVWGFSLKIKWKKNGTLSKRSQSSHIFFFVFHTWEEDIEENESNYGTLSIYNNVLTHYTGKIKTNRYGLLPVNLKED